MTFHLYTNTHTHTLIRRLSIYQRLSGVSESEEDTYSGALSEVVKSFRKFPDLNKCHVHESKSFPVPGSSLCAKMTKLYRFI
jgi:hypothetical protein